MPEVLTRFTTANIAGGLTHSRAHSDYQYVCEVSDVLCTQEMQNRDATQFVDHRIWGTVQAENGPEARCAIHWRRDRFILKGAGHPLLHISHLFPSGVRYFAWAKLYDKDTGRTWTIVNVHLVPHADDARGGITDLPRASLVRRSLDVLTRFIRSVSAHQVAAMGDFNTDLRADLAHRDPSAVVERFAGVGMVCSAVLLGVVPHPTHGHNLYDQMYFKRARPSVYRLTAQVVHPKRHSDHRAYSVRCLVRPSRAKLKSDRVVAK